MAAAADSAEGLLASKAGRALAFACSFTVCLLAAGALAITLFGRPHGPAIMLDLATRRPRPSPRPTPAPVPRTDDGAVTGPVTKPSMPARRCWPIPP